MKNRYEVGKLIKQTLTDSKISGIRTDIQSQIQGKIVNQTADAQQKLEDEIHRRVAEEINNLSAIHQI